MKNQNITDSNEKPDFLEIKGAKNPLYQPLAGKGVSSSLHNEGTQRIEQKDENPKAKKDAGKFLLNPLASEDLQNAPANEDISADKPALNFEATLKLVEELHRRMVQRGRLVHTIDNLDKFEIEQKEEAEDTTSNYYQGCELEITDDKRNRFSTKNPVIIKAVALFVRTLCTNRLAEIEAEIIIPA